MNGFELLEVSGESCANCFTLMPILNRLAAERNIPLKHIEAGADTRELVDSLKIERVPTVIVFKDGKEMARCTGFQPEEILSVWLDAKLEDRKSVV